MTIYMGICTLEGKKQSGYPGFIRYLFWINTNLGDLPQSNLDPSG